MGLVDVAADEFADLKIAEVSPGGAGEFGQGAFGVGSGSMHGGVSAL